MRKDPIFGSFRNQAGAWWCNVEDSASEWRPSPLVERSALLAAAALVPAFFEVAHERVLRLARLGALRLPAGCPSQGGKVDAGAHHDEAQHAKEDVLQGHTYQQQENSGDSA